MPEIVESGVPIPAMRKRGSLAKHPWDDMKVGDSFFVPAVPDWTMTKLQSRLGSHAGSIAKSRGTQYTVRQVEGGVRIWRIR